jgi:hypothetical protein
MRAGRGRAMRDTRETQVREDVAPEHRPAPRFKAGDVVRIACKPELVIELDRDAYWDYEFGGWLVCPHLIGIHESNFVLESEVDQWEPHAGSGLWSWWTRKGQGDASDRA